MKQSDLIFTVHPIQNSRHGYFHLELTVWVPRYGGAKWDESSPQFASPRDNNAVTFRWQWGNTSEHQYWYGFGIKPLHGGDFNHTDDMAFCLQVARKAIPKVKDQWGYKSERTSPEDVIAHLLRVGTYVVMDRRDGNYYQPQDVHPEGEFFYCARSGSVPGEEYAIGHTWARPEDATEAVGRRILEDKGEDKYDAWVRAGSPVASLWNNNPAPDLRSPMDRINPLES